MGICYVSTWYLDRRRPQGCVRLSLLLLLFSHFLTPGREKARVVAVPRKSSLCFLLFIRLHLAIWSPGWSGIAVAPGSLMEGMVELGRGDSGDRHGLTARRPLVVKPTLPAARCLPATVIAWAGGRLIVAWCRACVPDCLVGPGSPQAEV